VLTVPPGAGGRYLIEGQVVFATNSTGRRVVRLHVDTPLVARFDGNPVSTNFTSILVSAVIPLTPGQTVSLRVYQDSTVDVNVLSPTTVGAVGFLSVERL
jgi:hypothetical protein